MMVGCVGLDRDVPEWLSPFLVADYFTHCNNHIFAKNEKNYFCVDCVEGPICQVQLLQKHLLHRTLQIRRASHVNAVRINDIHKLIDVSEIQTYVINSAKIVFLLSRPQQKVVKGARHWCTSCGRTIADPVLYCSISCKLSASKSSHQIHTTSFSATKSDCSQEDHTPSGRKDANSHRLPIADASDMELSFEPSTPIKAELQASAKRRRIGFSLSSKAADAVHKNQSVSSRFPLALHAYNKQLMPGSCARTLLSSWTLARDKIGTFRMRRRKGTPHRAPLF